MTEHLRPTGRVIINVKGQSARPRWEQLLLQKALNDGQGASQELRFTCRIAQDANDAFARVQLPDGSSLTLNPKAKAQFGRNQDGLPFLTVGVVWSKNGLAYRLQWIGSKVPLKAQQLAVAHDEGRRVAPASVQFKFGDALITPVRHDVLPDGSRRKRAPAKTGPHLTRRKSFDRLCAADLLRTR